MRIHALSNAGMLVESQGRKVLIDALARAVQPFPGLAPDLFRVILRAESPFDALDTLLITHEHLDHCDARMLREFHLYRPEVPIVSTPQVTAILRDSPVFSSMVQTVKLEPFGAMQLSLNGLDVDVVRLEHAGNDFADVHNLAYVLHLEKPLAHMGDSEGHVANVAALSRHLPQAAVICTPFFNASVHTTRDRLRALYPDWVYLMHLPVKAQDRFGWLRGLERALARERALRLVLSGEPGSVYECRVSA